MRSWLRILPFIVLSYIGLVPSAHGVATLDPAFGDQGLARTDFGGADHGNGVIVQGDGRIVSVGYRTSSGPSWYDFIGERLEPDGTALDQDFGTGGGFLTPMSDGQANDYGEDVALAPDGRIVVAGYTIPQGGHSGSLAVARYETDGDLDPTFDSDGKSIVSLVPDGDFEQYYGVAVQSDGKILVTGAVHFDSSDTTELAVVRLDTNGSLDSSFSGDGFARVLAGTQSQGHHIRLTPGGRMVVAGFAYSGGAALPLIARLTSTGALDRSFDGDGMRVLPASLGGTVLGHAGGVDVTGDGRVLVGLWENHVNSHHWGVARLTPAGALDGSFGGGDAVVTSTLTSSNGGVIMRGLEIDGHGRIVVGGSAAGNQPAIARYSAPGVPDAGFGSAGAVVVTDTDAQLYADGFTVDASDRPLLSGDDGGNMVVARFTAGDPPGPPPGDGGGNPGASSGNPRKPVVPPVDTQVPVVSIVVKRDIVVGRSISIPVRVSEAADLTAALEVSARNARRLSSAKRRRRHPVIIGRGRASFAAAGRKSIRVKFTSRARRALARRRRPLAATLRVRATDRAGNVSKLKRTLRLGSR